MTTLNTRHITAPRRTDQHWHRLLMLFTSLMTVLVVISLGGLLWDHRLLGGVPIWQKPFKFAVSFALYGYTLAWMLTMQRRARRIGSIAGNVIAVSGLLEMALIVVQVVRGQASHFNVSTALNSMIYNIMGALAGVVFLATFVLAALLSLQRTDDRARRWSVRFGLLSSLVGMALAMLMLVNVSPAEVAALHAGAPTTLGGHSIGVPDGGPAMPITGWSLTGGDLRIPHFVGLHGLQALPLLGLLLTALAGRFPALRPAAVRLRLLVVGAIGYAGLIGLVLWQAERGQSIAHPDWRTLTAAGALAAAVGASTAIVLRRH
jgi:hypothetical protein